MLPLSREVLITEIGSIKDLLGKWEKTLSEHGFPELDYPQSGESLEGFIRTLCGELQLCGTKCEAISEIFMGSFQ